MKKKENIFVRNKSLNIACIVAAVLAVATSAVTFSMSAKAKSEAGENTYQASELKVYYDIPLPVDLQDYVFDLCSQYKIDYKIVFSLIEKESEFDPLNIGDNGESFGLMQIQKQWHTDRMEKLNAQDLLNPYDNVKVGIDYLSELIEKNDGNVEKALIAYNLGQSGAIKNCFSKGVYSINYSKEIIKNSERLDFMFSVTDDPLRDSYDYQREQEKKLKRLPKCTECGEYIQDEMGFRFDDAWYCEDCINSYRTPITEYEWDEYDF